MKPKTVYVREHWRTTPGRRQPTIYIVTQNDVVVALVSAWTIEQAELMAEDFAGEVNIFPAKISTCRQVLAFKGGIHRCKSHA